MNLLGIYLSCTLGAIYHMRYAFDYYVIASLGRIRQGARDQNDANILTVLIRRYCFDSRRNRISRKVNCW
jgi:hypothetical protein